LNRRSALFIYNGSVRGKLSGGESVYGEIRKVLKSSFEVRELIVDDILDELLPRAPKLVRRIMKRLCLVALIFSSFVLFRRYDLVVTTWTPEVPFCGDVAYMQTFVSDSQARIGAAAEDGGLIELFGKRILALPMSLLARVSLRTQTFVTASVFCQENIEKQFGKKAQVIYPPVQVDFNLNTDTKENIVLSIGRISLGRVSPEKNFMALANVGPHVPQARFVLAGPLGDSGEQTLNLIREKFEERGLGDHFEYVGWISGESKERLLNSTKVLFHPAINDIFPLAVVEAMNHGAIPIVHASGGAKECVPPENVFEDENEAIQKIKQALTDWSPSTSMEFHKISLRFDENRFRNEFLRALEEVSRRKQSAISRPDRLPD
jgi:glycosyltransferase involved in cell wall biosynthesis